MRIAWPLFTIAAALVGTPASAQDSDAPFSPPATPSATEGDAAAPDLLTPSTLPPAALPPTSAEVVVKSGPTACVAAGRLEEGLNVLPSTVRRPRCTVLVDVTYSPVDNAVDYEVTIVSTGRDAKLQSRPSIRARPGQEASFDANSDKHHWVRVRIQPD